jgi:hypothetical protein
MPSTTLDFDAVREIAKTLGSVEENTIHGAPSLKVRGKLLACPALVVRISPAEREQLISEKPDTYYLTDHYAGYPMVLVRLSRLNRKSLQDLLERSLQFSIAKASKSVRNSPPKSATRKRKVKP